MNEECHVLDKYDEFSRKSIMLKKRNVIVEILCNLIL